jgi:hypothetical protein
MKRLKAVLVLTFAVLGAVAGAPASAAHHGGHVRFGVFVGPGYWYPPPYYAYPPYYSPYYYPPVVTAPAAPPTYVEQGVAPPAQAAPAQAQGFWYYCDGTKAYYPYVKDCPGGWQRVAPQPAN